MLVLSRKSNEKILIQVPGYPVMAIQVVEIRGDKVRLGIDAPKVIGVHREEVYNLIQEKEAKNAVSSDASD